MQCPTSRRYQGTCQKTRGRTAGTTTFGQPPRSNAREATYVGRHKGVSQRRNEPGPDTSREGPKGMTTKRDLLVAEPYLCVMGGPVLSGKFDNFEVFTLVL